MMKPEYCPDYVGVACVDGTCPVANCEEYAEWRINMSKKCVCGVCLSFPVAGTASIIRAVKTVQSLTIVTER